VEDQPVKQNTVKLKSWCSVYC